MTCSHYSSRQKLELSVKVHWKVSIHRIHPLLLTSLLLFQHTRRQKKTSLNSTGKTFPKWSASFALCFHNSFHAHGGRDEDRIDEDEETFPGKLQLFNLTRFKKVKINCAVSERHGNFSSTVKVSAIWSVCRVIDRKFFIPSKLLETFKTLDEEK